jgi:hypothetical protein
MAKVIIVAPTPSGPETWQSEPRKNDYDPGPDRVVQGKRDARRAERGHRQQSSVVGDGRQDGG